MEIPHHILDLWATAGGVAGTLALIVALFMYLVPLTDKPALRTGRRIFLGLCMAVLLAAAWNLGWLQKRISVPVWSVLVGPFVPLALFLGATTILRRREQSHEAYQWAKPLTKVLIQGIAFPISNGIVADDPICTECDWETSQVHPQNLPGSMTRWRCKNPDCRKEYTWSSEGIGHYKDIAAAAANATLRKRGSQQKVDTHFRL